MALLGPYEDEGVAADPQLQQDVAVGAEHGENTALVSLGTLQLHQQTELIWEAKHKHTPSSSTTTAEKTMYTGRV